MNENALYEAKLIEVYDNLEELKSIDVKIEQLESQVKNIEKNTKEQIRECYLKNGDNVFFNDLVSKIYYDATKELDSINFTIIRKYEEFYIIINTYKELKNTDVTKDNINKIKNNAIDLLKKVLHTRETIENYNEILDKIFEFAYKVVKCELTFTKTSEVLNVLKEYDACISPIAKLIKNDIQDLSKENQEDLKKELGYINKNGFDDIYYLDCNLISFLINKKSAKDLKELEKDINDTYLQYKDLAKQTKDKVNVVTLKIQEIKDSEKKRNALWRKRIVQKSLVALNLAGILGASLLAFNLTDKIPDVKHYKTTYTVYDSSNPEELEEKITYDRRKNNKLEITEYSPWEDPGYFRKKYTRNKYSYTLKENIPYSEDMEDYLNTGFQEYINASRTTTTTEKSKEKPKEEYKENKYVIKQTYQNRADFKYVENKVGKLLAFFASMGGIIIVDWVILLIYGKNKAEIKEDLLEIKETLEEQKRLLLEEKNSLNTFNHDLEIVKKKFLEQFKNLPKELREDDEIQKRMRKLNENED